MSGGSYNYIYNALLSECEGRMYDAEMDDLIKDLAEVLHALEWWQSSDTSEDNYREELARFKNKWFECNRETRLKDYIDAELKKTRDKLYSLIMTDTERKLKTVADDLQEGKISINQARKKTIQRPLECRNAHCGAMCSPAQAEGVYNPNRCIFYERRDDLY